MCFFGGRKVSSSLGKNAKPPSFRPFHCIIFVGFEFSEVEPSALVQKQGGPCAVIAPVQAYLLKISLHSEEPGNTLNLKEVTN